MKVLTTAGLSAQVTLMTQGERGKDDPRESCIDVVRGELELGLGHLDRAASTNTQEERERSCTHARMAHDTIVRLMPTLECSDEERSAIEEGLEEIQRRLRGFCLSADGKARNLEPLRRSGRGEMKQAA